MKFGTYGNGNTNFAKLAVKKFPLHLFNKEDFQLSGCGPNALALITGVDPKTVKGKDHASDRFMVNFLRRKGFSVYQITKANLTNTKIVSYPVTDQHVVLYSSLVRKKEATWGVLYSGFVFHNFEITKANMYQMINWQWLSAYIIHHTDYLPVISV